MNVGKVPTETQALLGANYCAVIDYTDLNDTAGTTKTLTAAIPANTLVKGNVHVLVEDFSGPSITSLVYTVGDGGDADFHMTSTEVEVTGTEVDLKVHTPGSGAASQGKVYTTADTLDFAFTASGANLNTLTAGKLKFYFTLIPLADLKNS